MRDSDFDGIPDSVDADATQGADIDNDGIDDRFDATFANGPDTDSDGVIDSADPDANGDGFATAVLNSLALGQALPDTNGDGEVDLLDPDNNEIQTGLRGYGGCTIGYPAGRGTVDPLLLMIVILSGVWLPRRRRHTKYK